jgi:WD40 repeat protein
MKMKFVALFVVTLTHLVANPAWTQTAPVKGLTVDIHGNALLAGAIARLGTVAFYHPTGDYIAYSANGKVLASGGSQVFLWDPATGRELGQFQAIRYAHGSRGFALSPNGELLFVASVIYDTRTGKEHRKLDADLGEIFHAAFSPDGKLVATATRDGRLGIWETATGKLLHGLVPHGGPTWAVAFSSDGKTLFSGENWSKKPVTRIWEVKTGQELKRLDGAFLALATNGDILATPGERGHSLNIVNWRDGKTLVTIKDFPGRSPTGDAERIERALTSACFSRDGKVIATTCGFDAAIRLWDTSSGKAMRMIPLVANSSCVAFAPDGKTLAVGTPWGLDKLRVRMFDPNTGEEQLLPEQLDEVYEARFLPDGKWLISTGSDKKVRFWQATGGKATLTVALAKRPRAIAGDGSLIAVSGQPESSSFPSESDRDKIVEICDASTGKVKQKFKHENRVVRVAFSADGTMLAAATEQTRTDPAEVYIWNTNTGKLRKRWAEDAEWSMVFSPDGKTLATGGNDLTVKLWQTATGELVRILGTPVDRKANQGRLIIHRITGIAFSADGQRVAGAAMSQRRNITVWNVTTGEEICQCVDTPRLGSRGRWWVKALSFSADGKVLFSGGDDRSIRVWDAVTGNERTQLPGHRGDIHSLVVSRDGTQLASASKDGTVLIWNLKSLAK